VISNFQESLLELKCAGCPHVDRIGSVYISRKQGQFQTAFVRLSMVLSNGVD